MPEDEIKRLRKQNAKFYQLVTTFINIANEEFEHTGLFWDAIYDLADESQTALEEGK